jgi:hypothetical protein
MYLENPDILRNKSERWVEYLRAAANGRLLARPPDMPRWKPHKYYGEPIFGALQSSYDHVERELSVMCGINSADGVRTGTRIPESFVFIAGDGLSIMRINHLLANHPEKYIHQTPMCIPIQGAYSLHYLFIIIYLFYFSDSPSHPHPHPQPTPQVSTHMARLTSCTASGASIDNLSCGALCR